MILTDTCLVVDLVSESRETRVVTLTASRSALYLVTEGGDSLLAALRSSCWLLIH